MADEPESDATISEVAATLSDPIEYVRVVLGNMQACRTKHGNASVRIGVTGTGKMPYHKVTYMADGKEQLYGAFDGSSPFRDVKVHEPTWGTESMSFDEVLALIGRLRNWKGKKRPTRSV